MTARTPTPDDLLRAYLRGRAATAKADGLVATIVKEVSRTEQVRRRPSLLHRFAAIRLPVLAAVPLVLAVAVLGTLALRTDPAAPGGPASGAPASGPPVAAPSGSPTPTPSIGVIVGSGIDGAPLAGGRWQTAAFEPTLRFTVPDGLWAAGVDIPRQLWLRAHVPGAPATEFDAVTLLTVQNVYVDPCTRGAAETRAWSSGGSPDAFLDWLETNGDFDLGPRREVTILGEPGIEVEFTAPDMSHCAGGFMPISDNGRSSPFGTAPAGTVTRYAVIELGGATVLVGTWTTDPDRRDAVWAAADAVLESIEIVP